MRNAFTKKHFSLAVASALALGFASGAVHAQNFGPVNDRQIWVEQSKQQVWRNGYGECWHSQFGPPPPYGECNPAPVAQYVAPPPPPPPPPPPAAAPPPPPPPPYVAPAPAPVVVPAELPRKPDRN